MKKITKHHKNKIKFKSRNAGRIIVIAVVACFGVYMLSQSHAATSAVNAEAENGTLAGNAAKVSDTAASGGSAVKFGTSGSGSQSCANPLFTSSNPEGTWDAPDGLHVQNDMWNGEAGPQTIYACSSSNFYAISNQPEVPTDIGSVKTYPSVFQNYNDAHPFSYYTQMDSTFSTIDPPMGEWDAVYDIWFNNWSSNGEYMIWYNTNKHPDVPPAGATAATVDGVPYHFFRYNNGPYIAIRDNFVSSGSINLLDMLKEFETLGMLKPTYTLTQVTMGVEISVTESSPGVQGPEKFITNGFTLNVK